MLRCLKCVRCDFCNLVTARSVMNPMKWPVHVLYGPTQTLQIGSDMNSIPPIPVSVPSKVHFCTRLIAGIAGSNIAEGMDICLLRLLCVV